MIVSDKFSRPCAAQPPDSGNGVTRHIAADLQHRQPLARTCPAAAGMARQPGRAGPRPYRDQGQRRWQAPRRRLRQLPLGTQSASPALVPGEYGTMIVHTGRRDPRPLSATGSATSSRARTAAVAPPCTGRAAAGHRPLRAITRRQPGEDRPQAQLAGLPAHCARQHRRNADGPAGGPQRPRARPQAPVPVLRVVRVRLLPGPRGPSRRRTTTRSGASIPMLPSTAGSAWTGDGNGDHQPLLLPAASRTRYVLPV